MVSSAQGFFEVKNAEPYVQSGQQKKAHFSEVAYAFDLTLMEFLQWKWSDEADFGRFA